MFETMPTVLPTLPKWCGAYTPPVFSASSDAHVQASSPPQLASLEPLAAASNVAPAAGGAITPRSQQAVSAHPLKEVTPNGSVGDGVAAAGGGSSLLTPRGTQDVSNRYCWSTCSTTARSTLPSVCICSLVGNNVAASFICSAMALHCKNYWSRLQALDGRWHP